MHKEKLSSAKASTRRRWEGREGREEKLCRAKGRWRRRELREGKNTSVRERVIDQMAAAAWASCICGLMVAASFVAASTSPGGLVQYKIKKQRITLYGHEVLDENSFQVSMGLSKASRGADPLLNFGTVFAFKYPLFPAYNFTDEATAPATISGTHTVVCYTGYDIYFQQSIDLKDPFPVGTLTLSGVFSYSDTSRPVPIVGGTGAYFRLARGIATYTLIDTSLATDQTYRIDLDLELLDEDLLAYPINDFE